MSRLKPIRFSSLLILLLTGCAPLWGNSLPTPWPTGYLPTAVALTMAVLPTWTPPPPAPATVTPTLAPPPPAATATATLTLSPTPFFLPSPFPTGTPTLGLTPQSASAAVIQVNTPGPLSRVRSPIALQGYVIPGYDNLVRIELIGEDGRLLARQLLRLYTSLKWAYLNVEIPFEVQAAAEVARLQVSTQDAYGRLSALNSVRLLLLSAGFAEINPPGSLDERCVLDSPLPGARLSAGTLTVSGQMRPFNDQPLVIELITSSGAVVGSKMVAIQPAPDDRAVPFAAAIGYSVTSATWARLTLRQSDERIGGTMYLFSREIYLTP
jgi:hypothetical protein